MKTRIRSLALLGGLLLLMATASLLFASSATADLPLSPCSSDGTTTTCELWAMPGTLTMPDGVIVPVWGFATSAAGPAEVPGPALIGNQDETMVVTLHNDLPGETLALAFPGQALFPDLAGAATGATATYTFTLSHPGTFLYEAGLTISGTRQVAMGLYGGLVVRPVTPTQAYEDPNTAFDDEVLLVLSEVDPLFNNDPAGFAMPEYTPRYWLINGQAYPDVPEIEALPGQRILLRYVNAGFESHWMGLLGLEQEVIASDGVLGPAPYRVVVKTLAAGQTVDALTTVPLTAVQDDRYALYDTNLLLHNASQRYVADGPLAYGGMMTFLRAVTTTVAPPAGPVASNVLVSPSNTPGDVDVTLSAQLSGTGVDAAEFFTNTVPPVTARGTSMVWDGANATAVIPVGTLANWSSGFVVLYVRGHDANGWGPVGSVVLNLDKLGPRITGMSLSPEPSNGSEPLLLRATGDDHTNGRNNVISGTYTINGGAAEVMNLARTDNPITAMTATLTVTTLGDLAEGLHPIAITAKDSLGNLGVPGIITLTLDQTGPEVLAVSLSPELLDLSGAPPLTSVRLDTSLSDVLSAGAQSPLANAEAFIDIIGSDGTGFNIFPSDGLFDEIAEDAYFEIPITNFLAMAQGDHVVYVHGQDAAGNWGAFGQATITVDKGVADTEGPETTELAITLARMTGGATVRLAGTAAEAWLTVDGVELGPLSNVAGAEWFVDTDPGEGAGTQLQAADGAFNSPTEVLAGLIDISTWSTGDHTLYVRALDSSGNWGAPAEIALPTPGGRISIYLPLVMTSR